MKGIDRYNAQLYDTGFIQTVYQIFNDDHYIFFIYIFLNLIYF